MLQSNFLSELTQGRLQSLHQSLAYPLLYFSSQLGGRDISLEPQCDLPMAPEDNGMVWEDKYRQFPFPLFLCCGKESISGGTSVLGSQGCAQSALWTL